MIDMHAHWRPAELTEALRARTREPRIVRNQDGAEVLKSRYGEEPLSRAFDDVDFHLARMDRQGVGTSVLSLLGSFCWFEAQPLEASVRCAGSSTTASPVSAGSTRAASPPTPRCRWWTFQPPPRSSSARWGCRA